MFTAGASPGIRLLALAVIIMTAFPASITIAPFFFRNKFQAAVFIHQDLFKLNRRNLLEKHGHALKYLKEMISKDVTGR
jgi:hypothetical protein